MSLKIDEIETLIKLAEEFGVEIIVSNLSDKEIWFAGLFLTTAFSYVSGVRSWLKICALGITGGTLFRLYYSKIPGSQTTLSQYLRENLSDNEQKQLCSKMRLIFKNLEISKSDTNLDLKTDVNGQITPTTPNNRCIWNVQRQKQQVIEQVIEFVKEKYNVLAISK